MVGLIEDPFGPGPFFRTSKIVYTSVVVDLLHSLLVSGPLRRTTPKTNQSVLGKEGDSEFCDGPLCPCRSRRRSYDS